MKVSLGIITKEFNTLDPIEQFLGNASKYGHSIYSIVIVYSHNCDFKLIEKLRKRTKVFPVKINSFISGRCDLLNMGISVESINTLLNSPTLDTYGLVPYGIYRNYAVIEAMLTGSEVLVFIDTDVYPKVLTEHEGEVVEREIDFIGRHLEYLKREDVIITTSDYSGYYIIPPMKFDGMKELLIGLQKEAVYGYILESNKHKCLNLDNYYNRRVFDTDKILGGNVAIKLKGFRSLPPFFSTVYTVNGEAILTRGEDTLLGLRFKEIDKKCIDIDTKIFHDTYSNYPEVPDIRSTADIKDRFYYACLGWIGRNPFLNWIMGRDIEEVKGYQMENIKIGAKAVAKYLNDERFLILPKALEISYKQLNKVIKEYNRTLNSWNEFIEKFDRKEEVIGENINDKSFSA
ncbi:MAG: hypothetical protein PWQ37_1354 [Candidatus Petromonas sp.]|jgi:hypothetical protein|nr:hypothetical protein [Candidatus Petromonas sp.]